MQLNDLHQKVRSVVTRARRHLESKAKEEETLELCSNSMGRKASDGFSRSSISGTDTITDGSEVEIVTKKAKASCTVDRIHPLSCRTERCVQAELR